MATQKQKKTQKPKRTWQKRLIAVIACLLAILMLLPVFTMVFQSAFAATKDELQEQINSGKQQAADLSSKIKKLQSNIDAIAGDKSKALEQKRLLDEKVAAKEEEIANTKTVIANYDALISQKEQERQKAVAREEEEFELFCKRVRSMEEAGTVSYWSILFNAADFSDLLDRVSFVGEVMEYDNAVMDQLAETRRQIEDLKANLESARADQQAQKDQLVAQKNELDDDLNAAIKLVEEYESKQSEYQAAQDELKAEEEEIQSQILKKQKELQEKIASGQISFDTGTGWQWPLPGIYRITCRYGNRIHPITGLPQFHTGNDIGAPRNTPIHAARGGVITKSTYGNSYGNYVVVDHGDGYITLYAHMNSRAVSEGQVVTQGQVIGYVGTTGSSTGNHLHFEVRYNGKTVDGLKFYPSLAGQFVFS